MTKDARFIEQLVGIEGVALLRGLAENSDGEGRLAEVRALLGDERLLQLEPAHELEAGPGYAAWAATYDEAGNPILALEQPAVWSLVDPVPPGRALDAACGTGRHARHLVDLGHEVLGIDIVPRMLDRAASKVPEASFAQADLRSVPAPDGHFDLVVCGLALGHLADLPGSIGELARVLKPGGSLVTSVLHPFQVLLGWHARFTTATGERHFVRERPHSHSDYLQAFRTFGLEIRDCLEPALAADHVTAMRRVVGRIPDAAMRAYVGTPGLLVWAVEKR